MRLTDDPAYDGVPNWSPDGQSIAFTSERAGNADIFIMNADGSDVVQFTEGDGAFNVVPAWSPDDSKIAFASNRNYSDSQEGGSLEVEANAKLWSMAPEGGQAKRITSRLGLDMFASWSPDGQSLVYMSVRDENSRNLYAQTGHHRSEFNQRSSPRHHIPVGHPMGKALRFISDRDGDMDIFIMNLGDRSVKNITLNPAGDGDPAWSPDGSQIAFISDRDGNVEIYIMNADGSNIRRITNDPADDTKPAWQPRLAPQG